MTAGTPPAAATGGGDPLLRGSRASRLLGRHPVLVSTASTIAFVAVLGAVISVAPGTPEVARNFFSPTAMRESFFGTETTPAIWKAFIFNIEMFVVAEVLILVFALLIAVARQMRSPLFFPLRMLAIAYTDLFRGIPLLLVIYFTGFGLPALGLKGIPTSLAVLGVPALVLSYSAYVSEVYRA